MREELMVADELVETYYFIVTNREKCRSRCVMPPPPDQIDGNCLRRRYRAGPGRSITRPGRRGTALPGVSDAATGPAIRAAESTYQTEVD
ncbi:hypothetical protein FJT64_021920 [Amphibalanus amphitrite]|uniref:Uncharacterized protein n=1 Tax=Amphibalanus amphitrite TaxID=1232801 RepID=A0A6A4WMV1_AMPAM|nr:hypothetical protein FJT64_021920 [Amphibalanus amphitrite]